MGPITYKLCHTAGIGVAMWITGLCAFPPPVPKQRVELDRPGLVMSASFSVPADKKYPLVFGYKSSGAVPDPKVRETCGFDRDYETTSDWKSLGGGRSVKFKVVIRKAEGMPPIFEGAMDHLCITSNANGFPDDVLVGYVPLAEGAYKIEVFNVRPYEDLKGKDTYLYLAGGWGKG